MGRVIAAIVALALAVGGLGAVAALILRWGLRGIESARTEADVQRALLKLEEARTATLVEERDTWKQKADVAAAQLVKATARLARVEQERNEAYVRERDAVSEAVKSGDATRAADAGNRILSRPLPKLR